MSDIKKAKELLKRYSSARIVFCINFCILCLAEK